MIQAEYSALYSSYKSRPPARQERLKASFLGFSQATSVPPWTRNLYLQSCGQAPPPTMEMGWLDHFPRAKTAE